MISGSEARHMTKVIRMARGDRFVLMGGKGEHFLAVVHSIGPREVRVDIERALTCPAPSPVEITLCQALLRSDPMDYLIQKTSELGVDRIFPFFSSRTVAKIAVEKFEKKVSTGRALRQVRQNSAEGLCLPESLPRFLFRSFLPDFRERIAPNWSCGKRKNRSVSRNCFKNLVKEKESSVWSVLKAASLRMKSR